MSRPRETKPDLTGIEVRHQQKCRTRAGAACNCRPGYRATAYAAEAGKTIRKTFATASAAASWRGDRLKEIRSGLLAVPTDITVDEAIRAFLADARAGVALNRWSRPFKPSTLRSYEEVWLKHLSPPIGTRTIDQVDRLVVKRLVEDLIREGASPRTVRNALMPLRSMYRKAVDDEIVRVNPVTGVRLPDREDEPWDGIERSVVHALVDAAPTEDRALIATALYAGLRRGELQSLPPSHIDLRRNRIRVRSTWDKGGERVAPKSRASRRDVPIIARLRPILAAHLRSRPTTPDGFAFGETPTAPSIRTR